MKTFRRLASPAFRLLSIIPVIFLVSGCKDTGYLDIDAADRAPLSAYISFVNARPVDAGLYFWTFTDKVTPTPVAVNKASEYLPTVFGNVQINFTEGVNTSYKASYQFGNSATFTATGRPNGPIATFYHTVVAARTANTKADSLILFYDDLKAPASGKAKLRFINLSPGASVLDVVQNGKSALQSGRLRSCRKLGTVGRSIKRLVARSVRNRRRRRVQPRIPRCRNQCKTGNRQPSTRSRQNIYRLHKGHYQCYPRLRHEHYRTSCKVNGDWTSQKPRCRLAARLFVYCLLFQNDHLQFRKLCNSPEIGFIKSIQLITMSFGDGGMETIVATRYFEISCGTKK
jgi:hypothetical protein